MAAMAVDGILPIAITTGTYNAEAFIMSMQQTILPHLQPYPQARSVLVLDGASIHKDERLVQLVNSVGAVAVYLPPYSPEFNPIEKVFAVIKMYVHVPIFVPIRWLKRHKPIYEADPIACLHEAFSSVANIDKYAAFAACGYTDEGPRRWHQEWPLDNYCF